MVNFTCRYCRTHLAAYIEGELTLKDRRRIARHLDECPSCYARYVQQRELSERLLHHVPLVGQPQAPQLQRMWTAIQTEMVSHPRRPGRHYPARYGLVALMVVLVMLFPWMLGNRNVAFSIPSQPAPATLSTRTPKLTKSPVTVALVATDDSEPTPQVVLRNTPEPRAAK